MTEETRGPQPDFWLWAGRVALIAVVALFGLRAALMDTGLGNVVEFLTGLAMGGAVVALAVVLARLGAAAFQRVPTTALVLLGAALLAVVFYDNVTPAEFLRTLLDTDAWEWPLDRPAPLDVLSVFTLILGVAFAAGLFLLGIRKELPQFGTRKRAAIGGACIVLLLAAWFNVASLVSDGNDPFPTEYRPISATPPDRLPLQIAAPDPTRRGSHPFVSLSYGAGENERRPEFGDGRDLESRTVDASPLLPEWKGIKKRMREWYWGFGLEEAPLNGLFWAPEGDGPFPLALIVHGNHGMEEYSDPGYAYLGELLASQGIIAVSVDQNYINGTWSGDFRGKEMATRAWLLLEHLRLWRDWNETPGHRFAGRVDMDNIALIGHSRGGEAVSIAYAYNSLPHFPDDATVGFDYGFDIQALVAIAQIDHRYPRRVELEDVNFLALQGSYDSDESAFHGLRQFNRIALSDDEYRFKAGLYIHGANHGQFNSIWGLEDASPPAAWGLNLDPIIGSVSQQKVAKAYVAAFLAATLKDDLSYLPLFRDPRRAAQWLPDLIYVQQFTDSTFVPIATFEEDLDVTTATADDVELAAYGMTLWREEELKHRDERLQGSSGVVLGWNGAEWPVYGITIPPELLPDDMSGNSVLSLSITASTETPPAEGDAEDEDADASSDEVAAPRFTIETRAADGSLISRKDSTDYANLAPPLKVRYLKSERLNKERYKADWEPILQTLEIPLVDIGGDVIPRIREILIIFDGEEPGVVILDDIGIRRINNGE